MRVLCDRELRRATRERMFMLQGDRGSRKQNFRRILFLCSADVNYFGTRKMINSHRLGDLFHLFCILLWCELQAQMAAKCLVAIQLVYIIFKPYLFTKRSPRYHFCGFVSSARNFSKCSKQIWYWLSLSKFAFLIHTSHSLKAAYFLRAVYENLSLFWNLWAFRLNTQPQHIRPFSSWWLTRFGRCTQWHHARRPSLQHGFNNGGCSNCSGREPFAVTVRLKDKFTS